MKTINSLDDVRVFAAVADAGSFTAAARALGVSKSHVSTRVRALEDALGARLLDRTTRRARVTEAGRVLHDRVARALDELAHATAAVRDLDATPRGTLRMSVPAAFGVRHLTDPLVDFAQRWPALRLDVSYDDRPVDPIADGFDLVVRIGALADSSLVARRLASTRAIVCAAPAYLADRGHPRAPAALAEHACLTYAHERTGATWVFESARGRRVSVAVRGPLHSDSADALLAGARRGLGVVRVPDFFVCDDLLAGRLVPVLPGWQPGPPAAVWALYPHARHLSPKVRACVDHLVGRFQPVPPWTAPTDLASAPTSL